MPVYLFKTLAFISFVIFSSALLSQQDSYNVFQIGRWSLTDERYSDCWGYTDNKGREYALIGATHGTAIVNITDSTNIYPVSFISGPVSNWRDIKTWRNYAYVTTEGGDGIQIINLTLLPDSAILVATYRRSVDNAHNLFIDEHGFAYVCGATNRPSSSHGGLNILDLADPLSPVEHGTYSLSYIHDVFVQNDTAYAAALSDGIHIIDVSDKLHPRLLNAIHYPSAFTHNTWKTDDGRYLYTSDEYIGGHLRIWDVRDPFNVQQIGEFIADPQKKIHNVYVKGHFAFMSYFSAGLQIADITDPEIPVGVGYHLTSETGAWGVFPYFPSGKIVVSDITDGLYVFRFTGFGGPSPGKVEGVVKNVITEEPIRDVRIDIFELDKTVFSDAEGRFVVASLPGELTLAVSKRTSYSGFFPDTIEVKISEGVTIDTTIFLNPLPFGSVKGKLVHSRTGLPVASITVRVSNTPLLSVTDLNGEYVFPFLLADTSYTLEILKFGFRPVERVVFIQPNMELVENITLPREIVDDMEYDLGWTIGAPGDNSINGIWQRDIPSAVWAGSPPIAVQPDSDHTSNGVRAFVTGASSIIADNPEGKTTLSSPIFDLTDHVDPILEYYRWFFTKSIAGDDFLQVDISNDSGRTWVNLEKVAATENSWTARQFRISDYLPSTTTMLVRFITADSGDASVVDALVDDFSVYDISTSVENIPTYIPRHYILYQSYPNPFNPSTTISYDLPVASKVKLTVFNILGQEIATLVDDYQEAGGYKITYDFSGLASGIYLYRLEADNFIATQKMLLMR